MRFSETYSEAVRETRRIRAQRAGFWAKWVSLALLITIGATLRSEPGLRQALMSAGMDAVMALTGSVPPSSRSTADTTDLEALLQQAHAMAPSEQDPDSQEAVKVNRPGISAGTGSGIHRIRVTPSTGTPQMAPDPLSEMAAQIGGTMQEMQAGQ